MSEWKSAWIAMLGAEVRYETSGEYRTRCFYKSGGDEAPLVLIHGVGGHAESYLRNLLPLAERLPNRDVYSIDLIGHGYSSKTGEYNLADYGEHVGAFVDSLDHDTAHIHGESLGAMVAAWVGVNRPEIATTLGLNTMALVSDDIHHDVLSDEQIERMNQESEDLFNRTQEMMDEDFPRDLVKRRVEWLFHGDAPEELVDIRYHIYQQDELQKHMPKIYSERGSMEAFDRDGFAQIDTPTLVIHTDHNPGTPADTMEHVHENYLPNSEYYQLEDAAHWPQWERAEQYNEHTADFVMKHD